MDVVRWPLVGREAALDRLFGLVKGGTGGAILGPAGVGKSRLLHELSDRVRDSGIEVVPVVASESTRSIPFAPFVELLPGGPTPDELSMLGAARQALESRAGARGVYVSVDDAHLLDPQSLSFLISTVASGIATVGLTARTGEPMASDLVDLWTNGVIERIDLAPLTEEEARELLETGLGSVSDSLFQELWRLSEGNPLVLHEIIEGAVGTTIGQDETQQWVQVGSLVESPRLSDLVSARLRSLPEDQRNAMEVLALGAPLPIAVAQQALGAHLRDLEERRLVDVSPDGNSLVTPDHPLHGEVLAAQIGSTRRRGAYRQLVEAAMDVPGSVDPLRMSVWQKDSGEIFDIEVAISGANEAIVRHDPALAAELLEPLDRDDDRVALLLGKSLSYRNMSEDAESVLSGRSPREDHLKAEFASVRGQNLAFGLGRVAEARELFESAAAKIVNADLRARLNNERAMISGIRGDFEDVEAASRQVLDDPVTSDVSRAAAYVSLTVAYGMTGDCIGINSCIKEAREVATMAQRALPFAREQIEIMQLVSYMNEGRLDDAIALAAERFADETRPPAMTSTTLGSQTLALIETGLLRQALKVANRTMESYQHADPFGLEPQARGLAALARGQMGDPEADSEITEDDLDQLEPRLSLWVARGRAWAHAARGDIDHAVEIVLKGGRQGLQGQHTAWAAMCLHDAVRFGRPEAVIDELAGIDTSQGAHYIAVMQQHAQAAHRADPERLGEVAARFEEMGSGVNAAEAYARQSHLWLERNDVAAARSCFRSRILERQCEDAATPALKQRAELVTDREVDVVMDAIEKLTSSQIAERRYISVRTVDNHLRSVYRKLGVSGREELSSIAPLLGRL